MSERDRAQRLQDFKERLRNSWSYSNVLALAIAKTESPKLSYSSGEWNRVIYDLREETKDEHPQLLEGVYFDARDMRRLYSGQVESFLSTMRRSGLFISCSQGQDSWYEITQKDKEDIIENQSPLLKPFEPVIDDMAKIIDERLGRKNTT